MQPSNSNLSCIAWNRQQVALKSMWTLIKWNSYVLNKMQPWPLGNLFTYFDTKISSTERDVNIRIGKVCIAVDRLLFIFFSDFSDKIKREVLYIAVSVLMYGYTNWIWRKSIDKKIDWSYTKMLEKSLKLFSTNSCNMTTYHPFHNLSR